MFPNMRTKFAVTSCGFSNLSMCSPGTLGRYSQRQIISMNIYLTMKRKPFRHVPCVWWFMCIAVQWISWPCGSSAVDWRFFLISDWAHTTVWFGAVISTIKHLARIGVCYENEAVYANLLMYIHGITLYMVLHYTWYYTIHGITLYMVLHYTWYYTIHGITLYMVLHYICKMQDKHLWS